MSHSSGRVVRDGPDTSRLVVLDAVEEVAGFDDAGLAHEGLALQGLGPPHVHIGAELGGALVA